MNKKELNDFQIVSLDISQTIWMSNETSTKQLAYTALVVICNSPQQTFYSFHFASRAAHAI